MHARFTDQIGLAALRDRERERVHDPREVLRDRIFEQQRGRKPLRPRRAAAAVDLLQPSARQPRAEAPSSGLTADTGMAYTAVK